MPPGVDETFGWGRLAAGGLDIHAFPGRHGALIAEPIVQDFASRLLASMTESGDATLVRTR